jgi:O-antigen/teichoic acid export membrane protein
MSDSPRSGATTPEQDVPPQEDVTGRDRLVSNVLFSWGAHLVFIVAGFILPRMIDRRLGQELLGVWDFSWSVVTYFQLVRASIGSSVNRYVAKYWAADDTHSLNQVASSATCVLSSGGLLVMGLTVAVSLLLPHWFGNRLGPYGHEAQWVVLFLGASVAVQISFSAFNGILTGCHCWGLHNLNTSGWHAVTVAGMVVALLSDGKLWMLAAITLAGEVLASLRRVVLSYRVCKGLRLRPSFVHWSTIRRLFFFGGKTLIPSISSLLLDQTSSVFILAYLGPSALALYSRPCSLICHVRILVAKMAMVLTPTTSSLQSRGDLDEIRELVITATRYSLYLALPMVLMLVMFGGAIMQLWMGPRYARGLVPAILATGYLPVLIQLPALNILAGLNAHGRPGVARLIASLCSVGLNILVLRYLQWGLVGTAVAVTLPLAILNMVDIPHLMCRRVGLGMGQYFRATVAAPALHLLPFAVCLVATRLLFRARPFAGLALGVITGGGVLAVIYWRNVLPKRVRVKVLSTIQSGRRAACGILFGK